MDLTMKKNKSDDEIINLPPGMSWLENQVAGHHSDSSKKSIRMLKTSDGCILKAAPKKQLQEREVSFYEEIKTANDPLFNELAWLIPKYYGTKEYEIEDQSIEFLILEDITANMLEPCVMDIKIGKRTWDPLADPEKIAAEKKKYSESKAAYGFCIPGFQVYDQSTGLLRKFNKDYGKKLTETTVINALKTFLNATENDDLCPILLMKIISSLRKIEKFFKKQDKLRFYSSSILVAYDANYLRKLVKEEEILLNSTLDPVRTRRRELFRRCRSYELKKNCLTKNVPTQRLRPLSLPCISFHKNSLTDETITKNIDISEQNTWVRIKMIDFTHVFPGNNEDLDENYLEGITNLIKLLESLLIYSAVN